MSDYERPTKQDYASIYRRPSKLLTLVCCHGCGRDVIVTRASAADGENKPVYCHRCVCPGSKHTHQSDERRGRPMLARPLEDVGDE